MWTDKKIQMVAAINALKEIKQDRAAGTGLVMGHSGYGGKMIHLSHWQDLLMHLSGKDIHQGELVLV